MNSREFKKLNKKWQKKLKDSGFNDLEEMGTNGTIRLKSWANSIFARSKHHNSTQREATTEYYRLAGLFLHDYEFEDEEDKLIWELHSQGLSRHSIEKRCGVSTERNRAIVKRLVVEMKKLYGVKNE